MQLTKAEANYLIRLIQADIMAIDEEIEIMILNFDEVPTGVYEELVMARRLKDRIASIKGGMA